MKPLNIFQRFILWIKSKFRKKQLSEFEINQQKIEMCQDATLYGTCKHHCRECAWNVESYTGVRND